jgi:hypothetical protein
VTGRQPASDEPESYHRQWLHTLEDEATVPSREMQLARVYADYAPASGGRATRVSTQTMRRHTHMSTDAISAGNKWLVKHGWLVPHGENGQRKTYDLTFGCGGAKRKPIRQPERSADRNRSDSRNGQGPDRSDGRNGRRIADRSDSRNGTVPTAGSEPFRQPEREQKTEGTERSLSGGRLHRALAAVVPDVTERETHLIREKIGRRPGVRSDVAVMLSEIEAGKGGALVADIRAAVSARTSAPLQYAALCGWCSRPGHDADNCPNRPEPTARPAEPAAETPCAAGENCRCKHTPVPDGHEYHEACQILGGLRAAREQAKRADQDEVGRRIAAEQLAEMRAAAPSQDGGHAA